MRSSSIRLVSITETVCTLEGDDQPYVYRETVDIPAPGLSKLIVYYFYCVAWYGIFISLAFVLAGIDLQPAILYASLVMSLNGAVRSAMRFRECTANHVHWEIPVARQRQSILILSVISGAVSSFLGLGLLVLLIQDIRNSSFWAVMVFGGMVIESYRGGTKIGAATIVEDFHEDLDKDFDIDNYTNWTRVRPADPHTGG